MEDDRAWFTQEGQGKKVVEEKYKEGNSAQIDFWDCIDDFGDLWGGVYGL